MIQRREEDNGLSLRAYRIWLSESTTSRIVDRVLNDRRVVAIAFLVVLILSYFLLKEEHIYWRIFAFILPLSVAAYVLMFGAPRR